jgi:hypothetical protein
MGFLRCLCARQGGEKLTEGGGRRKARQLQLCLQLYIAKIQLEGKNLAKIFFFFYEFQIE